MGERKSKAKQVSGKPRQLASCRTTHRSDRITYICLAIIATNCLLRSQTRDPCHGQCPIFFSRPAHFVRSRDDHRASARFLRRSGARLRQGGTLRQNYILRVLRQWNDDERSQPSRCDYLLTRKARLRLRNKSCLEVVTTEFNVHCE